MFDRLTVATNGSETAWRAIGIADGWATRCGAELEILQVVAHGGRAPGARRALWKQLADHPLRSTAPRITVKTASPTVSAVITEHAQAHPRGLLVMDSFGRGRSAAVLGSVTVDVLRATGGPLMVVGPRALGPSYALGDLVVPVDGSSLSAVAVGLGAAWAVGLGVRPWVVTVLDPDVAPPEDVSQSSDPEHLAHIASAWAEREVEFEVLHDRRPGRAVAAFATAIDASLIVASSHGLTGWARLAVGSVGSELVRWARCPVVLIRPPQLDRPHDVPRSAVATGS